MKTKRRTGYGVFDLSRQVARRIQQEWDMVESPRRQAPMSQSTEVSPLPPRDEQPKAVPGRLAA